MNRISYKKSSLAAIIASAVLISGCSSVPVSGSATTHQANVGVSNSEREAELDRRAAELEQREIALNARYEGSGSANGVDVGGDLLPPNAAPGECYARVWVDAEYVERDEQVLITEASNKVVVIPATYETVTETLEVSAASSRLETIPAVYGTEEETVKVRDGRRIWRSNTKLNSSPVSEAMLASAAAHGINLDGAQPGMCFHEHYVPATYRTETEQVVVKAQTETVNVIPAQYTEVEETVLVREASTRLVEVPAEFAVEEEQIIDKPAHTIWKKGSGPIQRIDEATGEIMCLVEVPATYKTVKRTVLKTPAQTRTEEIPAEYKTVTVRKLVASASAERTPVPDVYSTVERQVLDQESGFVWHEVANDDHPASTRTGNQICLTETQPEYKTVTRTVVTTPAQTRSIEIPAEYKTVEVTKLVSPASENVTQIPAEYRNVTKRELVKDGYMAWRSILCETNMTTARISNIQRALEQAGYDLGANGADGVIGADTIKAVNAFQIANGLPVDKYLNIKTLKALGVSAH